LKEEKTKFKRLGEAIIKSFRDRKRYTFVEKTLNLKDLRNGEE